MDMISFPCNKAFLHITLIILEIDGQSAGEKNAGGVPGYQMESGHKKTLEGQMIGQKRKRDDGTNIIVTIIIWMHAVLWYNVVNLQI